jgi:GT2 family glycosyltransferase
VLNDDTVLQPEAVTRLVRMLDASPELGAAVPVITDGQGTVAASRIAYPTPSSALRGDWTDRTEPPDADHGFLQGCCLALRVAAIEAVGPFDERFFLFYEDTDLSRRLTDAGWSLGLCPDAVVVHVGHATVFKPGYAETTPLQGRRSRYLYFAKHRGRVQAEVITAAGRLLLFTRATKAWVGWKLFPDETRRARVQRLYKLARFNPHQPL